MTRTILVVDDEPDVIDVVSTRLQARGWDVFPAADGRRALELLAEVRADLVILDLMMPGMDGLAFLARLRKEPGRRIPVLVVSAYGIRGIPEAALAMGADGYLPKPFSGAHLESKVALLLGEPPREGAAAPSVLLVDDEPEFRRRAADALGRFGCAVTETGDWASAVRLAQVERPDVLLIDVGLPEIRDHDERLGDAHDWRGKEIPVIMLAEKDDPADGNRARRLGADLVMARPVAWDDLAQQVLRMAGRGGT